MNKDRELEKVIHELTTQIIGELVGYFKDEEGFVIKLEDQAISQIKALYKPLGKEELEGLANDIELKVMAEITDRRGFRQEWDCMDKDIQNEIEETLIDIISQAIINARGEKLDAK